MKNIPKEYTEIDFGFSAVDEEDFHLKRSFEESDPQFNETDLQQLISEAISPLEEKINLLLQKKRVEESSEVQHVIEQTSEEVKSKVVELEKIIMPLLVNLLKTADREYIYWPNRAEKVQETIDKILSITRG